MNYYRLFRRIHLYSAFTVMIFLVMYFLTGFLMVRYQWFDHSENEPLTTETRIGNLEGLEPEDLSRHIQEKLNISGKRSDPVKLPDGRMRLGYNHVKYESIVYVDQNTGDVTLERSDKKPYQIISTFHRIHRYGGGWIYNIYVFMMDIVSASLLIFVISGVYLWFKVIKNKWLGLFFLLAGLTYTIWICISFMKL